MLFFIFIEKNTTHTKRALDLGCGTGSSTFPLTEFIDEVIGVDISSSQIEQAVLVTKLLFFSLYFRFFHE